jgi:hypothetical protein
MEISAMDTAQFSDSIVSMSRAIEWRSFPRLRLTLAWALIVGLLLVLHLTGCTQVMDVKPSAPLSSDARWVLLPFGDYGETPQAGERAEELVTSMMRVRWNVDLERYPSTKESAALVDLDERQRYERALKWARDEGFVYGMSGSVQEWRYRSGAEGEAAVGLTLKVINIKTGRSEWLAAASRSGFGAQTVSGVAEQLVRKMVAQLRVR